MSSVLVTGGAGYVGSCLVPRLLEAGHKVTVLDLYLYGDNVLENVKQNPALREIKGDLRNPADVKNALRGCDSVIHLACISNDPSFELDVDLGKSINYDCFRPLVKMSKDGFSGEMWKIKADNFVIHFIITNNFYFNIIYHLIRIRLVFCNCIYRCINK